MRKIIALVLVVLLALAGWLAAGPYLAINGIRGALERQDMAALSRHVDFPALRVNMKAHVNDYLVRQADGIVPKGLLGQLGMRVADGLSDTAVDALLTPVGIAALLQGHSMVMRAQGRTVDGDTYGKPVAYDPFRDVEHRFESHDRFTATVRDAAGDPMVFVFARQGLRWKLVDVRFGPSVRNG